MAAGLRYMPDPDQIGLVAEIEPAMIDLLPLSRLRSGGSCEQAATWAALDQLGILAAGASAEEGGLSIVEQALIAAILGRVLASPGVLATLMCYDSARGGSEPAQRVAAGIFAAGPGDQVIWVDEPGARLVMVPDDAGVALYEMPGDPHERDDRSWGVRLLTGTPFATSVRLEIGAAQRVRLLLAAALAGIAEAALRMAVDYAKVREQFGRPIGSFQAIKHHCADMAIAAKGANDLVRYAAVARADGRPEAAWLIECAFLEAAAAAVANAGMNIQVHGGIGFSAEADPHLLLKRAQVLTTLGGGSEAAAERIAASGTDPFVPVLEAIG